MIVTSNGVELEKAAQGWRAKTDPNYFGTIQQFAIGAIFGDFWEDPTHRPSSVRSSSA